MGKASFYHAVLDSCGHVTSGITPQNIYLHSEKRVPKECPSLFYMESLFTDAVTDGEDE